MKVLICYLELLFLDFRLKKYILFFTAIEQFFV